MTDASEMVKLYSNRILALAADIPHADRLTSPEASEMKRSPLCGSTVTVDVCVKDGVVSDFGQDVKACALGQASASVLGGAVLGQSLETIRTGRDQLAAMLKSDGPVPDAPFEGLEVLQPARAYKNRHASILLAFDATVAALESLSQAA
ncbi:MAG: iron-sulfur cluster assembly scaffold protein [Rhodobacteraceae bacterium]|nr:iron-sulfur cluster assembly scaffold protein [Paracoccaceae bacterium]